MPPKAIPAHVREQQINALPNVTFVRWEDGYSCNKSKAVCRCHIDGFEWAARVNGLINGGFGCPQCSRLRRKPADEVIRQVNALPNISFIRWEFGYANQRSKAVFLCAIDGHQWSTRVGNVLKSVSGCPQCVRLRRWSAEERVEQINNLPDIKFVRWVDGHKNAKSKAVCQCALDGFEWMASVSSLVGGHGCPKCHGAGYNAAASGTLYILRSECGSMVKIGISNDHARRHKELRHRTPFRWHCIELINSDDGAFIAKAEKELHSLTEQAQLSEPFDGYTEWRKWDDRIPMWIEEYRARA